MKIKAIYDNEGETADRYSVYFSEFDPRTGHHLCLGMSANPRHPQGFCQHCYGVPGKHNGKRIKFEELPEVCREIIDEEILS
jgi:hypothetical protein